MILEGLFVCMEYIRIEYKKIHCQMSLFSVKKLFLLILWVLLYNMLKWIVSSFAILVDMFLILLLNVGEIDVRVPKTCVSMIFDIGV